MEIHDEERDIYGTAYVQGKKYFLLEPRPIRNKEWWMADVNVWLAADSEGIAVNKVDVEGGYDYVPVYLASTIIIGSDALIDLLPVPQTKKVIRFYITDDEEA